MFRGCVCCSSSGELINALVEIAMRNQDEPLQNRIQHVILETTGLADPTPIVKLITQGANGKGTDDIVQNYYINSIVTLLDLVHFEQHLQEQSASSIYKNELIAQILTTDTVILNKTDLVAEASIETISRLVHRWNPAAKVWPTSFAKVPLDAVLNLRPERSSQETMQLIQKEALEEATKKHDPSIEQTMLLAPGFVDLDAVKQFIETTTRNNSNIYRVKGVLALKSNPNVKYVVQGVNQDQLSVTEHGPWLSDEVKESRITLIGRNVMEQCDQLEQEFRNQCLL
jgi:G3E family GTPase